MARMREIASEPSHIFSARLAFGKEKTSPYSSANDLAEGFIIAKKTLSTGSFLKCHGSDDFSFESDPSRVISVLVGTRDAIHKWLRMSGSGRCTLWIENMSSESGHGSHNLSSTLELVYRKRDYHVTHVRILQEYKLVLSVAKQPKSKRSKTPEISEDYNDFHWSGLRQRELERMARGDTNSGMTWLRGTSTMRWYVELKVPAFKQLSSMLFPGGALWEFRRLLLQVTNLPEFLDIDFCNMDLQEWLAHHPYAVFLIGRDAIMTRTTSTGLFVWKIVRFDFDQGVVTLAGGETLEGLLSCVGNYIFSNSNERVNHQQFIHDRQHHQKTSDVFEQTSSKCCTLDWAVWRGVYRAGPMETVLTSAFSNEDDCMVLKSLTTFFASWKDRDLCRCCVASDPGTAFRDCRENTISNSNWKLLSRERCALSQIKSVSQEVRLQGLRTLLDLLFDVVKDQNVPSSRKSTQSTAPMSTRSTPISSHSSINAINSPLCFQQLLQSKKNVYIEGKENVNLLLEFMAVMDRPSKKNSFEKNKKFVGSETDRALQAAKLKWSQFEEMKSNRSSTLCEKNYVRSRKALQWQQVLEWVDNGFLEVLLKEGMNPILKNGYLDFILIEELANACLQVVGIVPGEGTRHIVDYLISRLQNLVEVFSALKIGIPHEVGQIKELFFQQKLEKLRMSFEEMVCFCRLFALLVSSSVSIASGLADVDGLSLIVNLYSTLVKEFPMDVNTLDLIEHNIRMEAIPGVVVGLEKLPPNVSKSVALSNQMTTWFEKQEGIKSKRTLLQEISVFSRISLAFSAINSKVSNITSENNNQCGIPKIQDPSALITKLLMSTNVKHDVAETHACRSPMSKTIVDVVWKTKLHLLQSLVTMLESHSVILNKRTTEMKAKFIEQATCSEFLSWFLSDLIGGPSNAFLPYIGGNLNKVIYKIIYLLDKDSENNDMHFRCLSQEIQFNVQYAKEISFWNGQRPPPIQAPQIRLWILMLVELQRRMDYILARLMITFPGYVSRDGQKFANYEQLIGENAKTYFSSLWIDLARLSMVLSDYIRYWPIEKSKSHDVLQYCGTHFNQILTLLASLGPIASWAPAQILAMQSLLKLLGLCIQDSTDTNCRENWSEYENLLWKMLVDTWAHWNCIQSYVSWLALEVCQGCLINLLDNFKRSLHEPIRLYYVALEEQFGMERNSDVDLEVFKHSKLLPKKALMFLRLVVIFAQRKFYTYNNSLQDGSAYLCCCDNALWFLQEIMNPTHGLLILAIKNGPLATCADCDLNNTNLGLALELSSNIEQHTLLLLAQIFSLKHSPSNTHAHESCRRGCTNVFLSKKYVVSFLQILFSSFKILYIKVIQQMGLNSLCVLQKSNPMEVEKNDLIPLMDHSRLENNEFNENAICYATDEILSLCYSYAYVLLSIAKNLSEDGSQTFKDLCVMDFLIQEISLEYEFSQIPGPRSLCKDEIPANSTYIHLQRTSTRKNLKMFKELGSSNSSSNSIESHCLLPTLMQKFGPGDSTSRSQDFLSQRIINKNIVNSQKPNFPIEEGRTNSKMNILRPNESTDVIKIMARMPRDINLFDKKNAIKNIPIQFSCDSIYGVINLDSNIDNVFLKTSWESDDNKKEVVYSGRFFDLNEEVERELAKEEENGVDDDDHDQKLNTFKDVHDGKKKLTQEIDFTSSETQTQCKNTGDSSMSSTSTSTVSRTTERVVPPIPNVRPLVPKLNFTNSLQKTQSNLANIFDSETIYKNLAKQCVSNEDVDVDSKILDTCVISYDKERLKRPIYHNSSLHALLLELIISLMLNPEGALEVYYCDRFPMENQKINAPFYLFYHINHSCNEYVMSTLVKRLEAFHPSAYRILKLTWRALFDPSMYTNRVRIAQGALSQVYTATKQTIKDGTSNHELVVLKLINLPKGPHEPCSFFDVYSEVQILERFQGDLRVCQILDYGVDRDTFVLVLKHYKCSLRAWRQQHTHGHCDHGQYFVTTNGKTKGLTNVALHEKLLLYLEVYAAVLQAVKALEVQNVVHYDLKCDNILLEPLMCTLSDEEFWQPTWSLSEKKSTIPFRVSITDFGQSKTSFIEGGECTARNRGTECVKSPEMLKLLTSRSNVDALQSKSSSLEDEISVGKAGDVWGLGCLLYELLTGEYLLYDDDWVRFFMRVTLATEELIPDEKAAKLDNYAPIIDFLRFILVRDPNTRPSLDDLVIRLEKLQQKLKKEANLYELIDDKCNVDLDIEEDKPKKQVFPSTNVHLSRNKNKTPLERYQIPLAKKIQSKQKKNGHAKIVGIKKRRPNFLQLWRLCCVCCFRNVDMMQ